MASHFADRLCQAVKSKKTALTVGLDPVYNHLPAAIRQRKNMDDENDAAAAVDAIFEFCTKVLRIVAPLVPAVKLNIAFFERYLWEGIECYYSLISEANELGLEIIGDVKRGDIGHTAESYAKAHLQNPELTGLEDMLAPDAITINGFAGTEGIIAFCRYCRQSRAKAFLSGSGQAIHRQQLSRILQIQTAQRCMKNLPKLLQKLRISRPELAKAATAISEWSSAAQAASRQPLFAKNTTRLFSSCPALVHRVHQPRIVCNSANGMAQALLLPLQGR